MIHEYVNELVAALPRNVAGSRTPLLFADRRGLAAWRLFIYAGPCLCAVV